MGGETGDTAGARNHGCAAAKKGTGEHDLATTCTFDYDAGETTHEWTVWQERGWASRGERRGEFDEGGEERRGGGGGEMD